MQTQYSCRAAWLAVAIACLFLVQPTSSWRQDATGERSTAGRVRVFVTVHDGAGQLVNDLQKEEFVISVGGQQMSITEFRSDGNWPLFLGVLIDVSGSRRNQWPGVEAEPSAAFVKRALRPGDFAFVAGFNNAPELDEDPTGDTDRLARSIRRVTGNKPRGGSALYDSIALVSEWYKQRAEESRKALMIVTDGEDNASRRFVSAAVESALRTNTAIYVVCFPPERSRSRRAVQKYLEAVEQLARETGGAAIPVPKIEDFPGAFQQVELQIRGRYVLEFEPLPSTGKARIREIKVETTRKGLKVLARKGYYAPKN